MAKGRHKSERAVEQKDRDKRHGADVFGHPAIARHVRLEPVGEVALLSLVGFQVRVHLRQLSALRELRQLKLRLGLGLGVRDEFVDQLRADAENFSEGEHGLLFVEEVEERFHFLL